MGRTYKARGKDNQTSFDVNFSGAEILGYIMKSVDEHSKEIEAIR